MSNELVERINKGELVAPSERNQIGIENVRHRLRMYYGDYAEITVSSSPMGTTFVLTIPCLD